MRHALSGILCVAAILLGAASCERPVTLANACETAAGALNVATSAKRQHKLSADSFARINAAAIRVDALCGSAVPPSNSDIVVQAVLLATDEIRSAIR